MLKAQAVETLGQHSLLMPAWIRAALSANDRLKLYLSLLQAAAHHAAAPEAAAGDWSRELSQLDPAEAGWLQEMVTGAYLDDGALALPRLADFMQALSRDLELMARPVCALQNSESEAFRTRQHEWQQRLQDLAGEEDLDPSMLAELTHGDSREGDSLHLLVMDLHRRINALSAALATEIIDGAHVWQVRDSDRALISAFMRGLNRTAPLKFSHPGLDTAVTRDGERLLIQNDIGTNDVHVLVIEVTATQIALTYSDLHDGRFSFFRRMIEEIGFEWSVSTTRMSEGLNAGKPYMVGRAQFSADTAAALEPALEAAASRIVFVIDWNRARKRLQQFVRKPQALALLRLAAREGWGHMDWLQAGGEQLVFEAMQAVDGEAFRIGDRLDVVLGEAAAFDYLAGLMRLASVLLRQQQPLSLIADEARMLLARMLRQRSFEFDLMVEHAAYSHALAQALAELVEGGGADTELLQRCKSWEREADQLLMSARQRAERQPRWVPVADLLSRADDVADALEEAVFIHSLILLAPPGGLPQPVREVLGHLADTTVSAIQDQVRAVEIARHVSGESEASDGEAFLQALWRMLRAERICDELSRQAQRVIVEQLHAQPALFHLANEFTGTLEKATDSLLEAGYALRRMVLARAESRP
jgi:uncharacterized protein Yka (UPF0111/DUF47 family)